jgi:hypothetical protein
MDLGSCLGLPMNLDFDWGQIPKASEYAYAITRLPRIANLLIGLDSFSYLANTFLLL